MSLNLEQIADVLAIHDVKSRYFRYLDTKEWASWRELFTDDLVFYMEDSAVPATTEPITVGGDTFVEYVSDLLKTSVTVHHGHMPQIDITSEREATGVWAMFDFVDDPEGDMGAFKGYGHYHERYVKSDDGRWRIAELRLTRLRVDNQPSSRPAGDRPFPSPWKAGR